MCLKRFIKYSFIIITFFAFIFIIYLNYSEASTKKEGIENFPESYQPYLKILKQKYPNWNFIALYTGLDWNYVIDNENIFGKNLVPKSYSDNWKNTKPGEYNVEVDSGWVDSSRKAVEYTMDPRNFLNEVRIFQFETLAYDAKTNVTEGIEKILYGTEFYNKIVEYKNSSGNNIVTDKKYSDLILSAGITSNVSTYHLASRIKQEVGPFLSHSSISGIVPGYEGLYNFYNIGATSSSEPMGAIINGLKYAKDGKGATQETKNKYLIPWNTKERAITGGAIFIGSSYINIGQYTIYLQKFDVNDEKPGELFWHQYMTNVLAPYSESKLVYTGYKNNGVLNSNITFIIPVFDNMPNLPTETPNILSNDFTSDNTKMYANVSTSLNVRSGPGSSYEIITTLSPKEQVTRIAKGQQSGELWDRVVLENGVVGYVFQSYLLEVPEEVIEVEEIKLSVEKTTINKNEKIKLNVEILPEDATNRTIEYISSNNSIATVNNQGYITGISSGKCTITVKANNNVSASIDINVYIPVTEIEVDTENIILEKGKSKKINVLIYPEDATNKSIEFISNNSSIAQIDNEGNIVAVDVGKTEIIVKSKEANIEKNINIQVLEPIGEDELKFDESLLIDGNEISGIDYKNNTVEEIKKLITTNYDIEIYNKDNKLLENTNLVGTGCKIKILKDGVAIIEYQVILYGDVNGDGKINSVDLLVLQRHILEIEKFDGIFLKAGNINKNGKKPTSVDLLLIQRHILGLKIIEQRSSI